MTFPVFASGDVLNASDMNAVGLWLVHTQTIGTTVSSVTVSNVFSSTYDNYKIVVSGGAGSTTGLLTFQLGGITTGVYRASFTGTNYTTNAVSGTGDNDTTAISRAGWFLTDTIYANIDVITPNLAERKVITCYNIFDNNVFGQTVAYVASSVQSTGFTIGTSTGTLTGGTIRVYGFRN